MWSKDFLECVAADENDISKASLLRVAGRCVGVRRLQCQRLLLIKTSADSIPPSHPNAGNSFFRTYHLDRTFISMLLHKQQFHDLRTVAGIRESDLSNKQTHAIDQVAPIIIMPLNLGALAVCGELK